MKRPTPPPADLQDLIAVCLELYEHRGAGAVDEVLRGHPDSADLVRRRLDLLGRMGLIGEAPEVSIPDQIGDYRIERVLGRGGMGIVYEAEQQRPHRRVALKVLRSWPGENALGRFQHEAELLARLQHPGIAAIYEAGTAVVGGVTVPFFAMELVRGRPLDVFAAESGLDTRGRAALIAKVADAVHHAHQKGVVHRDLKPANVIVDERGEPHVLDFGIARAIDPDLRLETLRTEFGQLLGTFPYMSPEQTAGEPDRVDSQTDVYSLGAVAFELFAGRLPHEFEGRAVLDLLQAIRDDEPPRLGELDRSLRGDVETIVARALAKEKDRRYPSAHELAADFRRFLRHEPITARPATATYQLAKFAHRHRTLVGGAVAVVAALVLGLVGTYAGYVRAEGERDDAERRFRTANAVRNFQTRMFATADPSGEGIEVEDLLDRATLMIGHAGESPVETAAVRLMIGEAFAGIGAFEKGEPFLVQAVEAFERELGAADLQSLAARTRLSDLLAEAGRFDDAEAALEGVLDAAAAAHGEGHDTALEARLAHAYLALHRGRYEESVQLGAEVIRSSSAQDHFWARSKSIRSNALVRLGDHESAATEAREAYDWNVRQYGPRSIPTLRSMQSLGMVLQLCGRIEEGSEYLEEVLSIQKEVLGSEHPDTLSSMVNLFRLYYAKQEFGRAEEVMREAVEIASRVLTPRHPVTRLARGNLAVVLIDLGRPDEAEELLWQQLEMETETRGPEHIETLTTMSNLAMAIQEQNRFDEAAGIYLDVLDIYRRTMGDGHARTLTASYNLGDFYRQRSRYDEADPLLREAAQGVADVLDESDYRIPWIIATFALNLGHLGRFDEADASLEEARTFAYRFEEEHAVRTKVDAILETLARLRGARDR